MWVALKGPRTDGPFAPDLATVGASSQAQESPATAPEVTADAAAERIDA